MDNRPSKSAVFVLSFEIKVKNPTEVKTMEGASIKYWVRTATD